MTFTLSNTFKHYNTVYVQISSWYGHWFDTKNYANFAPLKVWNFAPLHVCNANFWSLKCFEQYMSNTFTGLVSTVIINNVAPTKISKPVDGTFKIIRIYFSINKLGTTTPFAQLFEVVLHAHFQGYLLWNPRNGRRHIAGSRAKNKIVV